VSGGSSPHSPYAFISHAPPLSSPLFPVPLTELEIQIRKLKDALDEFNLRNDELDLRLSQGSGAVKISFGLVNCISLHSVQAIRTACLCIPFVNDYVTFKNMYKENYDVVLRMSTQDVIALFLIESRKLYQL
jgi:hypothetical protein